MASAAAILPRGGRVVIVGGVAGGASCAARLRRLREDAHITLLDRGKYVSFANCGLPYYVGELITEEKKLLVATPELFRDRYNIAVKLNSEVSRIDRERRQISAKDTLTGQPFTEDYDVLVLSTGAAPIRPRVPGIDLPGVFAVRSIPDSNRMREWIVGHQAKSAVIVGGGFIGLEMAENLVRRGLAVTIVEAAAQVLPPLDAEMAEAVHERLGAHGIALVLRDAMAAIEQDGARLALVTKSGRRIVTDLVVVAIGVRPEVALPREAGIALGELGGVRVNNHMQTSDPRVFAIGDMVETQSPITHRWQLVPLAGPANRQGRLAADVIAGRPREFRGVQGTAVVGVFETTAALTGESERALLAAGLKRGVDFDAIYLHPGHHANYYPGAKPIFFKLLFAPRDGRVLGAQAVGEEGVEKRIDVVSTVIQLGGRVGDLEEAELCYAPAYGAAKDPVNVAGMIASNVIRGDLALADWHEVVKPTQPQQPPPLLLDVRDPHEFASGHVEGALNIPLNDMRRRHGELPRDREVWAYCGVGQRSYYACRVLAQEGVRVRNLPGGFKAYARIAKSML